MRKHNGMRPHDIAILLKIVAYGNQEWSQKRLAQDLFISISEISESLNRSRQSSLIDYHKKEVSRQSFCEFLQYGMKYVFPGQFGGMGRGMPTGHSHPFMAEQFSSELAYVWADLKGKIVGLQLEPLYPKQPDAAKLDPLFYKLMALTDAVRAGKSREQKVAIQELNNIILSYEPSGKY